jgi:hypothetical protein
MVRQGAVRDPCRIATHQYRRRVRLVSAAV